MHEKQILKSYGSITRKYHREMAMISYGVVSLNISVATVIAEMKRDDSDHGDIQSAWLNGPYLILRQLEDLVADLESKVNADPEISDKSKREFMHGFIEPRKDDNRKTHDIDAYVMNGKVS